MKEERFRLKRIKQSPSLKIETSETGLFDELSFLECRVVECSEFHLTSLRALSLSPLCLETFSRIKFLRSSALLRNSLKIRPSDWANG